MHDISKEFCDTLRPQTKRILYPHVTSQGPGNIGRDTHLRALYIDLKGRDTDRAKNYILKRFLSILATQPDNCADAVMTITIAACSEIFRDMVCDVTAEIIEEVLAD
jgi:hypothetical protein